MSALAVSASRLTVELPMGFRDAQGTHPTQAEVRAATGADALTIAMTPEYNEHPNSPVYTLLLLGRCVTRIGDNTVVTLSHVLTLHAIEDDDGSGPGG